MTESGEYRVFGPPGTGKTHYLTRQIAKAAESVPPQRIAVVSFTRTAAEEIASRVEDNDRVDVGTLHSFCYQALGAKEIADTPKWLKKWNQSVVGQPRWKLTESGSGGEMRSSGDLNMELQQTFYLRAKMVPQDRWKEGQQEAHKVWTAWKEENNLKDFTELIEECIAEVPSMPGDPDIGFFDEVQDFSALEMKLVRKWGAEMRQIVIAGDDDQSIYSFKGASPQAMLEPEVSDDRKLFLRHSYRLPSVIKDYAERWISEVVDREIKEYEPHEVGGIVEQCYPLSFNEPGHMMREVMDEVSFGRSVMVLGTCRYMIDPLCKYLAQRGTMFHNPYRRSDKGWNPLDPNKGAAKRVLSFLRPHGGTWENPSLWTWSELHDWTEALDTKLFKFSRGVKTEIKKKAKCEATSEVVLTQGELLTILNKKDVAGVEAFLSKIEAGDIGWFEQTISHKHDTSSMRMALAVVHRQKHGMALRREPQITVGTIHSVKGGQCDTVFVFPDLSRLGYNQMAADPDSITRLFYVALTRARQKVVLCGPESKHSIDWIRP